MTLPPEAEKLTRWGPDGTWCKAEDVAALEAENAKLRAALEARSIEAERKLELAKDWLRREFANKEANNDHQ